MYKKDILNILENQVLPDSYKNSNYIENLTFWIIRTDHYLFKFWKPRKIMGYDLKNMEERKKLCFREWELNKTLAREIYLDVSPVKKPLKDNLLHEGNKTEIIDYTLRMKRVSEQQKLGNKLITNNIKKSQIIGLAKRIARFHNNANNHINVFNIQTFQKRFEEVKRCVVFVEEIFGIRYGMTIQESIEASWKFLTTRRDYIQARALMGFIRDCHGDIKAGNICFIEQPNLMNRILFDEKARQIDILCDLARLGISFGYYDHHALEDLLLSIYLQELGDDKNANTYLLYYYYKLYRVSVLITHIIDETNIYLLNNNSKDKLFKYLDLMARYLEKIEKHQLV